MLLLLILISTKVTLGQKIELTEIPAGNGFILLRTDNLEIINNYTNIIHPINISEYSQALNLIRNNDNFQFFSYDSIIIHLIDEIENKIYEFRPQERKKRGLINLHGKFLKWIGGTMDDDDRTEIESKFNVVDKNLNILANAINNQTKINLSFEDEMNKIITIVNKQNSIISANMKKMELFRNNLQKSIELFKAKELIKENLRFLLSKLEKLEDIILNCRLGTLSHNILAKKEIRTFKLNIKHLKHIKSAVAQLNETLLIFIQIPIFSEENYFKTIIVPIPTKNKLELETNVEEIKE